MTTMKIARITPVAGTASGKRRGWIKTVTACDSSKTNGYAFEGQFLSSGVLTEVPVGALLLSVFPAGSTKNGYQEAELFRVHADDDLRQVGETWDWHKEFLLVRDAVCAALKAPEQKKKGENQAADPESLTLPPFVQRLLEPSTYVVEMDPQQFLDLTGGPRKDAATWADYMGDLLSWDEWPTIELDPETGQVLAHEGSHRMTAAVEAGVPRAAILVARTPDPARGLGLDWVDQGGPLPPINSWKPEVR